MEPLRKKRSRSGNVSEGSGVKRGKTAGRELSLRSFFMLTVFTTFCGVALLSGLVVGGCTAFRHYLLPDPNAAYLTVEQVFSDGSSVTSSTLVSFGEETRLPILSKSEEEGDGKVEIRTQSGPGELKKEVQSQSGPDSENVRETTYESVTDSTYSVQKLERGFDTLTPKRKLAYRLCGIAMVVLPALFSIGGILACGFYFYRKRLLVPLELLSQATEQIAAQNLDFSITYDCGDEMGALCRSFELMRRELAQNNRSMWKLLEQRRLMQASIAHDLRNPIAIIQGYAEYLQINLPGGKLDGKKAGRIVGDLCLAAKRLEQYTESVRRLNQLEDMEISREEVSAAELFSDIREDLEVMASGTGICLRVRESDPESCIQKAESCMQEAESRVQKVESCTQKPGFCVQKADDSVLRVDVSVLHRILENVCENALRFAESEVTVDFSLNGSTLRILVADDGCGFPDQALWKKHKNFLSGGQDGHLGMGLAISRVLAEKHGGSLEYGNISTGGARVKIFLAV